VLIEEISLSLDEGFVVFTGETGAGKSLLVKAIKLVLGEKASPEFIAPGEDSAEVEAVLWGGELLKKRLSEVGKEPEEEVHIKRIITPKRHRLYINGSPATLRELNFLTRDLVLLTSQHEYYSLFSREAQLKLLDGFLGLKNLLKKYKNAFKRWKELRQAFKEKEKELKELSKKRDFLEFQLKELKDASPSPEEEKELLAKREKLKNLVLLKELSSELINSLEGAEENLRKSQKIFEKLEEVEEQFKGLASKFEEYFYEVKEAKRDVESFFYDLPADDSELDEVEARLARYERLKKKYETDTEGLVNLMKELEDKLKSVDLGEESLVNLKKELSLVESELCRIAKELSKLRKEGAKKLEEELKRELLELGLEKSSLIVEVKERNLTSEDAFDEFGINEVRFMFVSNPGSEPKPLEKVASGGELSRIFLACKTVLKGESFPSAFIFDEVDTGIGGITAKKVAKKLKKLSENAQVVCITHLPQIAALADIHFVVEKSSSEGKTTTTIKKVEGSDRLKEIARMLGEPGNISLAKEFLNSL